jgi:hypothetical protein
LRTVLGVDALQQTVNAKKRVRHIPYFSRTIQIKDTMSPAASGNIAWGSARLENAMCMAYTLANHGGLQVLSMCAGALSGAHHLPR